MRICEDVYRMHARGSVVWSKPPSFKLDVAEGFHNHWHVKGVLLEDIPVTGVRMYNYFDDGSRNTVGALDCTRFIVLSDPRTGHALAIVDEHLVYQVRSTAAAAHPAEMGRPGVGEGAGPRRHRRPWAPTPCAACSRCIDFEEIRVTSRRRETREAFAAAWTEKLGIAVRAMDSVEDVVRGADIAVGGTTSSDIMTREAWLKPGAVFISLARREFEPEGWAKVDKVVIDSWEMNYLMPYLPRDGGQRHLRARPASRRDPRGRRRHQDGPRTAGRAHPRAHHRAGVPGRRHLPLYFRAGEGERARHYAPRRPRAGIRLVLDPQAKLAELRGVITPERCKRLLVELVRVPSPQTALMEAEPLLRAFIETAVEPRLRAMGFTDIRYDPMGNLISTIGAGRSGRSLMLITNAMNQPAATMTNAYAGDVADGAPFGLSGEVVLGKGASEQKANMAAMLIAMEAVLGSGVALEGRLVHVCCVSGETGSHAAIRSVIEGEGVRADLAYLGGTSLMTTLGNRGRIDVFITVHGKPTHSSRPEDGANAITGAMEVIRQAHDRRSRSTGGIPRSAGRRSPINRIRSYPESTHTIQASCDLTVDRRLLPGEDPDAAFAEIAAVARDVEAWPDPASGKPFRVEVKLGPFMYPSLVTTESEGGAGVVRGVAPRARGRAGDVLFAGRVRPGLSQSRRHPDGELGPRRVQVRPHRFRSRSVDRVRDAALVFAAIILRRLG